MPNAQVQPTKHPTARADAKCEALPSYRSFLAMEPIERIKTVKQGVSPALADRLCHDLGMSRARLCEWAGISSRTVARCSQRGLPLGKTEGEHLLGVARLVGEAEQIVAESGDQDGFDAGRWLAGWLSTPHPALGGHLPCEYVGLFDGRALLSSLLRRMQIGIYA
ncbi:antitoxin Xre-like helix-turn-helix domain-containing protein [Piscinibacter gummiphilus]|uniref:antitoxin Xre-like helix-turn-helix domain-containing protein n=1 Tax=Piscinibacter gummiphilus TaxID=946333 RepID=UPI0012FD04D4|nr:antitoxin Xre-like helix-turn-helix domain-containing protein [Piscinibacter gummiphilus]GLS98278.1 hypothetical protein GCM10007918_55700 [Piscinibacter gummiphilus]